MNNSDMPLTDEYMTYNEKTHRYVLTVKYVEEVVGIDMIARLNDGDYTTAQNLASTILDMISVKIYGYIHEFNRSNIQDKIIARSGRSAAHSTGSNALSSRPLLPYRRYGNRRHG